MSLFEEFAESSFPLRPPSLCSISGSFLFLLSLAQGNLFWRGLLSYWTPLKNDGWKASLYRKALLKWSLSRAHSLIIREVSFFFQYGWKVSSKKTKEVKSITQSKHSFLLKTSWRLSMLKSQIIPNKSKSCHSSYHSCKMRLQKTGSNGLKWWFQKSTASTMTFFARKVYFSHPTSYCMQLLEIPLDVSLAMWSLENRKLSQKKPDQPKPAAFGHLVSWTLTNTKSSVNPIVGVDEPIVRISVIKGGMNLHPIFQPWTGQDSDGVSSLSPEKNWHLWKFSPRISTEDWSGKDSRETFLPTKNYRFFLGTFF